VYFSLPVSEDEEESIVNTARRHGFKGNSVDYTVGLVVVVDEDVVSSDEGQFVERSFDLRSGGFLNEWLTAHSININYYQYSHSS
jgi:hypothetical protein